MRRRFLVLLIPIFLVGVWMWAVQLRFTPEAAVRSVNLVRGEVLQTASFQGGVALLLSDGGQYHAYAACRWALVFWEPCAGARFALTGEKEPVVESESWTSRGTEDWGISLFAGVARDGSINRIVWNGEERDVTNARVFLFARRAHRPDGLTRAAALSDTGLELYEWDSKTFYRWTPVMADGRPFRD